MFKVNEAGFVKRKEMDVHRLVPIFGLTLPKNSDNDAFNVLYGENLVRHLERNVNCEHNLKNDYLTKIMSKNGKAFYRYFQNMLGQVVLTNFRLIFTPILDL